MTDKFMTYCEVCGSEFQYGPHIYDEKHISSYNLTDCSTCYKMNWDGWASQWESKIIAHLKKNDIPIPERNKKGWLPRE